MKRIIRQFTQLTAILILLIGFTSCAQTKNMLSTLRSNSSQSPEKLLESGKYDAAIAKAVKKLQGKKKKKGKHVATLEEAFQKATAKDMNEIKSLRENGELEDWKEIKYLAKLMEERQELIEPLLPVIDKTGYQAIFSFIQADQIVLESKQQIADYFYNSAQEAMPLARRGDKIAAREAWNDLDAIGKYFENYKDRKALMLETYDLGQTYYLFEANSNADVVLPASFMNEGLDFGASQLNTRWHKFSTDAAPGRNYDYKVKMRITDVDISPERINEREYTDEKEIRDGWDYVYDQNGNVAKDTLGNDIKTPRFIIVRAFVLETHQSKEAIVRASIDVHDLKTNAKLDSRPITTTYVFENYASTYRGDSRALTRDTRRRLGNTPVAFPDDEELLMSVANRMKSQVSKAVSYFRTI